MRSILLNKFISRVAILATSLVVLVTVAVTRADQCQSNQYVYGENGMIDELLVCSASRSFDLDLTPPHHSGAGDQQQTKSTASRTLLDQGFPEKTTIVHAKLSGLWTAKRPRFVESGWLCHNDSYGTTTLNSIIEVSNLALEVIEKIDIPHYRHQHAISSHKPCKTFDLPLWLCRQSSPIYRTVTTWVNKAYFNVTLVQQQKQQPSAARDEKPKVGSLSMMFTCPETFKQKITHSPSAAHILSKYMPALLPPSDTVKITVKSSSKSTSSSSSGPTARRSLTEEPIEDTVSHPVLHTTIQSGKSPALPPYHNSVQLITSRVVELLRNSLENCIDLIDCDLSLMRDHSSFGASKYPNVKEMNLVQFQEYSECSNQFWIKNRIELANQAQELQMKQQQQQQQQEPASQNSYSKRSQERLASEYPDDPSQLLDPYGYYHQSSNNDDRMINNK